MENNKISILHLSDLHRSIGGEISNSALLSSLLNDKDRYTLINNPQIKSPDLIIVSGDIIRGSNKSIGSEIEIANQYEEGKSFLSELAEEFLGGNKDRLIVIPGNHDIDWKYSKESMEKQDTSKLLKDKGNLRWDYFKESISPNSPVRWNWGDLSYYKINDMDIYNKRLEAFSNFYTSFYDLKRTFSLDPKEQFDLFDYPDLNISIISFSSCFNNDHLRYMGDIHSEAIAGANFRLREFKKKGRLILATWHHNTKGQPFESNYMDSIHLKNFIDSGISIGFHGHQHKTELIHEYSDVIEQKKIIVFSAGTLCGGPKELPTGINRQYNIIELEDDPSTNQINVTLHVREKTESSTLTNPIWTDGRIDSKNVSHYTLQIPKPKGPDPSSNFIEIDKMIKNKSYGEAKKALLRMDIQNSFVRKFLLELVLQSEDYQLAIDVFSKPETEEEIITLLNSAINIGKKVLISDVLAKIENVKDSTRMTKELINKAKALSL